MRGVLPVLVEALSFNVRADVHEQASILSKGIVVTLI
jgi:hypothetical protein